MLTFDVWEKELGGNLHEALARYSEEIFTSSYPRRKPPFPKH